MRVASNQALAPMQVTLGNNEVGAAMRKVEAIAEAALGNDINRANAT